MHLTRRNPVTGKLEKKIQCSNCYDWQFLSEYDEHFDKCPNKLNKGSSLD
jgi:hypothetical protein